MNDETGETTPIEFKLPLPLDVAGTLLRLIGGAYPNAKVRPTNNGVMTVEIGTKDRVPDADVDAFLEGFTPDLLDPEVGVSMLTEQGITAPQWLSAMLGRMADVALGDAPNYIEAKFTLHNDGIQRLLTVARSPEQTPHELHMQAKDRINALEAKLSELGVDPDSI